MYGVGTDMAAATAAIRSINLATRLYGGKKMTRLGYDKRPCQGSNLGHGNTDGSQSESRVITTTLQSHVDRLVHNGSMRLGHS